jgi:hypothetical protein
MPWRVDIDASVLITATEAEPQTDRGLQFPLAFVTTMAGDYMPAFCARWPDGSFSIVDADDETHALIQLDELGDEPAQLWQLQSCLLDFELTDSGTLRMREFGEQTDVSDCQWLQYLYSVGLLRASFRPPGVICAIRSLWRHRSSLIQMAAEHVLHMQEALEPPVFGPAEQVLTPKNVGDLPSLDVQTTYLVSKGIAGLGLLAAGARRTRRTCGGHQRVTRIKRDFRGGKYRSYMNLFLQTQPVSVNALRDARVILSVLACAQNPR